MTSDPSPIEAIRTFVDAHGDQPMTLLGIGGLGGAGKTTLARQVAEHVADTQIVATDAFWTGSSFDLARLRTDVLDRLLAGSIAQFDAWDWATKTTVRARRIHPEGLIIIEGVCALHRIFRDDLRCRVWVDTPRDVRLERAVSREGEQARSMWETVWMPNELAYVDHDAPVACAHMVVDGTRPFH